MRPSSAGGTARDRQAQRGWPWNMRIYRYSPPTARWMVACREEEGEWKAAVCYVCICSCCFSSSPLGMGEAESASGSRPEPAGTLPRLLSWNPDRRPTSAGPKNHPQRRRRPNRPPTASRGPWPPLRPESRPRRRLPVVRRRSGRSWRRDVRRSCPSGPSLVVASQGVPGGVRVRDIKGDHDASARDP